MGTNVTRRNKNVIRYSTINGNNATSFTKNQSPYFYGVVTFVDPETRAIQFEILENNIGIGKIGNAIPAYKENITLPQLNDIVPLFTGPNFESAIIGEQYTKTVYYLNPISILQNLSDNSLVRSTELTAIPTEVLVEKENYLASDIGFALTNNGDGVLLSPQSAGGYTMKIIYDLNKVDKKGQVPKYVITTPNSNVSNNMAIVFGGMDYATPEWMEKQVPDIYKSNKVFLFVDSYRTKTTLNEALTFKGKNFPGYNITSVSGFSLGGYQAWSAIANNYKFIGLIDPSTNDNNVTTYITYKGINPPPSNIVMIYNINTWNSIPGIKANLKEVAPLMGPYAQSSKLSHGQIPEYFFKTYGGRL